ncbi:MAG: FRG domain-containing protein [Minwuia sp.]|nr:FRG domain-containing protein [Minwuia sp.]
MDYHSYFEPEIIFEDDPRGKTILANSYHKFSEAGFSDVEATNLVASGYCVLLDEFVIDRFYGGALSTYDMKTRFSLSNFKELFGTVPNHQPTYRVQSISELYSLVDDLRSSHPQTLIFRGQTAHYSLKRPVPNPSFVQGELGEISLLPSVWRQVLQHRMNVWHEFRDLSMFEWSTIIYDLFNIQEVHEKEKLFGFNYEIEYEDSLQDAKYPQILRDFHAHRQSFLNEYGMGSNEKFLTLLQHYGLYSPVLDLTTGLDVAIFFATQKFSRESEKCFYNFVRTNDHKAIIYVIRQDLHETVQYQRTKMLEMLDPLRPKHQACVVLPTNQFAMNLAGDFLVAAICLNFDMTEPERLTAADLFPSDQDDLFLAALKRNTYDHVRRGLTDFAEPAGA